MSGPVLPAELADDLVEGCAARDAHVGDGLYCAVLLLVLAAAVAMPLARVEVSAQASGIVRPATDKHEARASTSGETAALLVREHDRVARGAPLLVLRPNGSEARSALVAAKRTAAEDAAGDLRLLVDGATVPGGGAPLPALALRTARYREEYARYAREVEASARRWAAARAAVGRARALLAGGFAASIEVEDQELRLADADAERAAVRDRWLGGWHAALAAERATLAAMRAEAGQLAADERRDTVRAPVGGTVEELARLGVGSFVQGGDVVAVISPDVGLVAELYVAPRDVGLLRPGAPVRLQVDAFNYHDWGLATGRVLTISDDFVTVEGRPMFRVRSTLDPSRLVLRNGTRARVRKGMTLRARFPVARRSVLQLLRDDVNSWLSPFQDGTP